MRPHCPYSGHAKQRLEIPELVTQSNAISKRGPDAVLLTVFSAKKDRGQAVSTERRSEELANVPSVEVENFANSRPETDRFPSSICAMGGVCKPDFPSNEFLPALIRKIPWLVRRRPRFV